MLSRIGVITKNSFKEMYRDRFFLILVFGVMFFFVLSFFLGELTFEEHKRILFDLGISAIHWLNLGLCLFIGGMSLRKEIERQTYMTLLASPLSRLELLLGKFGGILSVIIISTLTLGVGLFFLLNIPGTALNFMAVLMGIIFESAFLLSLSLLMSLIFSPFVGVFTSIGIFMMGNWIESLKAFAEKSGIESYQTFANAIGWIFPNLYRLNWRSFYILEVGVPVSLGIVSLLHASAWLALCLFACHQIFRRKNLY